MGKRRIGVRELRKLLPDVLDAANAGAEIDITRNGRVAARLLPPAVGPEERLDEALRAARRRRDG